MKKIWLMADYAQAETRIVAWRGPVPRLKQWFQEKRDVHLEVAKMVCKVIQENKIMLPHGLGSGTPWNELTKNDKNERQILGKTTGHSNNYGLGDEGFALSTGLPVSFARIIQAIYHRSLPEIKGGYQKWIEKSLRSNRTLVNPLGRPITFYGQLDDNMFRAGYAWYPQSTIGDLITDTIVEVSECFEELGLDGVIQTPENIRKCGLNIKINGHDAIYVSLPDDRESIEYAVRIIRKAGEVTLLVNEDTLVIPMDFKIGDNMGELHDFSYASD